MSPGASRGEDLDRVLVAEVVGALDGVEGVRLGAVLGGVAERGVDAALGGAGMAPRRVQLRDHADVRAPVVRLDGCAHAGAPGADDEDVVASLPSHGRYLIRRCRPASVPGPCQTGVTLRRRVTFGARPQRDERPVAGSDARPGSGDGCAGIAPRTSRSSP